MKHLKPCPKCGTAAQQKKHNGFVRCSDGLCPLQRYGIPLQAWQSWPREQRQREQEVARLQKRVTKFGAVEQRNHELLQEADATKQRERKARRDLKSQADRVYRLEQKLKATTLDRDKRQLKLKGLTSWAVDGATVAWVTGNTTQAVFFEEALDQLGKHDATLVPCAVCAAFPSQHQYISQPTRLSCTCSVVQYSMQEWTKRQRQAKVERVETEHQARREQRAHDNATQSLGAKLDRAVVQKTIEAVAGSPNQNDRLIAYQAELALYQIDLIERLLRR